MQRRKRNQSQPPIGARTEAASVATDHGIFVWGSKGPSFEALGDGAMYDTTAGAWTLLPPIDSAVDAGLDAGGADITAQQ